MALFLSAMYNLAMSTGVLSEADILEQVLVPSNRGTISEDERDSLAKYLRVGQQRRKSAAGAGGMWCAPLLLQR